MTAPQPASIVNDLASFIGASPTSFHAAAEIARRLTDAGFVEQDADAEFDATVGGHFVVRDGAITAWRIPSTAARAFRVVGSHTDSPSFVLKPNPVHRAFGWHQAGMEVYGGPLLNSWLNRDLGLAGRIVRRDGTSTLVETGPLMVIPQLAPHLDRSDDVHLDRQQHLMPVYAVGDGFDILDHLCELAGIARGELGYYDIHATATEPPRVIGARGEFFASWRLDNLSSVFASLRALLIGPDGDDVQVMAAFDHEEVGSATRTGACGPFLAEVLERIAASLGIVGEGYFAAIARSSCVSADAGHAINPNYSQQHDPDNHPLLNAGPLLKINANRRYTTDGATGALWYRACAAAGVPTQEFVGNNAVPCGSTIGPLTATRIGIPTVDVGIPLLSMHSAREVAGTRDVGWFVDALAAYWAGA